MPKSTAKDYIATPDGLITVPPGSPKILIHTRQGRCVGIYCDQPAKVLCVETQDDPQRLVDPSNLAMLSIISPQTSAKLVGGYGTAVDHVLARPLTTRGWTTISAGCWTRTRSCWTESGRMSGERGGGSGDRSADSVTEDMALWTP